MSIYNKHNSSLQTLSYLLSGPLQKSFADPCSRWLYPNGGVEARDQSFYISVSLVQKNKNPS